MLRPRIIRPGIVTNEELAKLGPEAQLLFIRLWMLADREGRLEDRPARIRAEAFPYWPEYPVENLLKSLSKTGFIRRYKVWVGAHLGEFGHNSAYRGYIQVVNFAKHQRVNEREAKSIIPPEPNSRQHKKMDEPDAEERIATHYNARALQCNARACTEKIGNVAYKQKQKQKKKPPSGGVFRARELPNARQVAESDAGQTPPPQPSAENLKPKPAARTAEPHQAISDFWPHPPETVAAVRATLESIGEACHLPPPDDAIVRATLDACRGAPAPVIVRNLHGLYQRGRFREMRSWGLVPLVLAPWCEPIRKTATAATG